MRPDALAFLDGYVGQWTVTLTDAWFLDSREVTVHGAATFAWQDEGLLRFHWTMEDEEGSWTVYVIGYSEPQDRFTALTYDYRGVSRIFEMTVDGTSWTMLREDPDFHQRVTWRLDGPDRILAQPFASEDEGATWRKDFDLILERAPA